MRKTSLQPSYYAEQGSRRMTILKYIYTFLVVAFFRMKFFLLFIRFRDRIRYWYHSNNQTDLRNSILVHRN